MTIASWRAAPNSSRATLVGSIAILLWSALALLTTLTEGLPPFQVMAVTFAIGGGLGLVRWLMLADRPSLRQPALAWAITLGGLFGFHVCYFTSLKTSPAVAANLINYLWPLLIVLFSALGQGSLRWNHLVGGLAGFLGCALLLGGDQFPWDPSYLVGYGLALAAALIWSGYSVLARRFCAAVPVDFIAVACLGTALGALLCHLAVEHWAAPTPTGWLALVLMGFGPVGLAFFVWDHGVKHGNIRLLGAASYATPLLGTLLLILAGRAEPSLALALSAALIVGGAALAGRA